MSNTKPFDTSVSSNSKPEIFIQTKVKIYGDPKALTQPFNVLVKATLYEGNVYRSCRHAAGTLDSLDSVCELEDKAVSRLLSSVPSTYMVTVHHDEIIEPKAKSKAKPAPSKKASSTKKATKAASKSAQKPEATPENNEPTIKGEVFSGQPICGELFTIPSSESPDESLKATYQDILENKGLTEKDFPEVDFNSRNQVKSFIASQVD